MAESTWSDSLQASDFEPIVCQILDQPTVEILDWSIQSFKDGTDDLYGRLGVHRISGKARYDDKDSSWSVVLKVLLQPPDEAYTNDLSTINYWKREILTIQSGILTELPGTLVIPRYYKVQELDNGEYRIWMEDIPEIESNWTMEHHQLAARHLGQFNGAYFVGHPLPKIEPWMCHGRVREWLESVESKEQILTSYEHPVVKKWITQEDSERMARLWENKDLLLEKFDQLPLCLCHHDAFRPNLMLRHNEHTRELCFHM
jgi:hypothetical protein